VEQREGQPHRQTAGHRHEPPVRRAQQAEHAMWMELERGLEPLACRLRGGCSAI
jgi:hypothetical protein